MTQYCRYCQFFVAGNGEWCEKLNKEMSEKRAKSPNRCKSFELNRIDAYGENLTGYQERPRKEHNLSGTQITFDDMLTAEGGDKT